MDAREEETEGEDDIRELVVDCLVEVVVLDLIGLLDLIGFGVVLKLLSLSLLL